jgi:hypothetical protein
MVLKKIAETLSRARTIRAAQVLSPEDEPVANPCRKLHSHDEPYRKYLRDVVHDILLHNAAKDGTVRDCVHYTLGRTPDYSGRYIHEGSLVVMSPKDFNELHRLIKELSERLPPETDN